jgi:hypothetical protein
MPYNLKFYKTDSATARCLAGTGAQTSYTATSQSIIAQRDVDRKALGWAQAAARSMLRCLCPEYTNEEVSASVTCSGGITTFTAPAGDFLSLHSQAEANERALASVQSKVDAAVAAGCIENPVPVLTFSQYDGPFVFPAFAYENDGEYFLKETVSGTNTVKFSPVGTDPSVRNCTVAGDPLTDAYGLVETSWSGSVEYNMAGVPTGSLSVQVDRSGALGAYDFPGVPGTSEIVTGASVDSLFTSIALVGGTFAAEVYSENGDEESFTRKWETFSDATGGFFAGSFGGPYANIWCPGHIVTAQRSVRVTPVMLGVPVARTGDAARTQTLGAFNDGTRSYAGNMSVVTASFAVNESRPTVTVESRFLVTPTSGSPYYVNYTKDIAITGPSVQVDTWFPRVADSVVEFVSLDVSYQQTVADDFSTAPVGEVLTLAPSPSWLTAASFDAPAPNTDCWEDFELYTAGQITSLPAGTRWAGVGSLNSTDPLDAYDDFESYPVGTIGYYTLGTGWSGGGGSAEVNYTNAWDDFESYAVGAVTVLDFTSTNNEWAGDGSVG